jgi:hypothetical protein
MLLGGSLRGALPNPQLVTDEASLMISAQVFGRRAVSEDLTAAATSTSIDEVRAFMPHTQREPQVQAGVGISISYNSYGPIVNVVPEALIDGVRAFLPPYVHPTWLLQQDSQIWTGQQFFDHDIITGTPRTGQLNLVGRDTNFGATRINWFDERAGTAADQRRWGLVTGFGGWIVQAYDDAGTTLRSALTIARPTSGPVAILSMTYGNTTDNPTHFFRGTVETPASVAARASLRAPHGVAPSAPIDGDVWSTTAGFFVRVNGVTVGPLGAAGGGTTATEIEQNLGFVPTHAGRFAVVDAAIGAASKLIIWQAGGFYTGKNTVIRDEGSMDPLWVQMYPNGAGNAIVHWRTIAGMSPRYSNHRVERSNAAILSTGSALDVRRDADAPPMGVVGRVKGNFKFQYMVLS